MITSMILSRGMHVYKAAVVGVQREYSIITINQIMTSYILCS